MDNDNQYRVPDCNLDAFDQAVEKLNKKARKLSCPEVSYEIVGNETVSIKNDEGKHIGYRLYHFIEVDGAAPRIPGWSFQGVVDFSDPAVKGYILRMAPSADELPRSFRDALAANPERCDHCNTTRQRRETFIVRNENTFEYKLVGRSCLKDFTGHKNPGALASYFEHIAQFLGALDQEEGWGGGYYGPLVQSLVHFMTVVVLIARLDGFLTRREANERYGDWSGAKTTADEAWATLNPISDQDKYDAKKFLQQITDADEKLAQDIVDWTPSLWENKDESALSDFVLNLRNAASTGVVSAKTKGLNAAAYRCYEHHLAQVAKERLGDKLKNSEYQGEQGERLDLEVTCYGTRYIESQFGCKQLCKFHDDNDNAFTWFNSGSTEIATGKRYHLRGTVKRFSEYRGVKETQLTRCHATEPKATPAPQKASAPKKAAAPAPEQAATSGVGARQGSIASLVLDALSDGSPRNVAQLVEATGKTAKQVRRYANKLARAGKLDRTPDATFQLAIN
jgi:hypothetical protein